MAFLRVTTPYETPVIQGVGLFLRMPSLADYPAWAQLRAESRTFLTPGEPTWPADDLTRTATIGYWMGERHAGRGYMSAAVRALAPFAFNALRLHRLEAACLPHNAASMRL